MAQPGGRRAARLGAWIALAVLALAIPWILGRYYLYIACLVGVHVIIAAGLNLLTGYTGQVSFGHAGFAGLGGYTSVLLVQKAGLSFWLAAPAAACAAAAMGVLVGLPALRISGLYLSLVTFAFGRIMFLTFLHWRGVTNGYEGLMVDRPSIGGFRLAGEEHLYYLVLAVTIVLVVAAHNLVRSRIGRALIATRDSAIAAETLGVNVARYKTVAFAISAFYAGLGGALLPLVTNFINPEMFGMFESALYLIMVILGGLGTVGGPILGAAIMVVLPEALRAFKDYQELMYGLIFVVLLLFMPQGLVGSFKSRLAGMTSRALREATR